MLVSSSMRPMPGGAMRGGRPKGGPALGRAYVLRRQDLTPELMRLWLQAPPGFSFRAGQHCTLVLEKRLERPFFIASAPWELPVLELVARLFPDGAFSRRLWRLEEGDTVSLRWQAHGPLTFDRRYRFQVMVATSVGVAPFISVLRDRLQSPSTGHRFWLLHVGRGEELAYSPELQALASRLPGLLDYSFVPTARSPEAARRAGSLMLRGVRRWLDSLCLDPRLTIVYLSGRRCLLEGVARDLEDRGWRFKYEFLD